jgi:PEP-CTERM motif
MIRIARTLSVLAGVLTAPAVLASATYSFSTAGTSLTSTGASSSCGSLPTTSSSTCWGNTRGYSATESVTGKVIGVTAKAYSNTGSASSAGTNANAALQTAYLGTYGTGGLGVTNRDYSSSTDGATTSETLDASEATTPEHALDNNQRYDMVLLSFTQGVALSSLSLGYAPYDSDLSVWAYMGSGAPVLDGATYASMLSSASGLVSSGWVVVGNYKDAGVGSEAINTSGLTSSYWLVGAYNPGGSAASCGSSTTAGSSGSSGDLDCGDDYVKLLSVSIADQSTPTTEVPEPGTLLLTGLALAGIAANRKRRK